MKYQSKAIVVKSAIPKVSQDSVCTMRLSVGGFPPAYTMGSVHSYAVNAGPADPEETKADAEK